AGDKAAALRAACSRPGGVELRANGLVHKVRLHLGTEDRRLERDLLLRAPEQGRLRCSRRRHHTSRISTSPLAGPGTEPLIRSRFRSGSTACTTRPRCVTRSPPIRPAIRIPLNTRDGVAEAPIEPGLRTLCDPWLTGPLLKLCRLIVPANPFPIETPETLTGSPGANASTVTESPTVSSRT